MQERYTIPYTCGRGEAYFDALYGVLAIANRKPQKNCILTYPYIVKRTKRFTVIFTVFAVLLCAERILISDTKNPALLHITNITAIASILFAVFHAAGWYVTQKAYKSLLKQNEQQACGTGLLTIDATGICDETDDGEVTKRLWSQYDSCIITPRVIVIRTKTGTQLCLPSMQETAQRVGDALTTFGYGNTIHVCVHKEK